MAADGRFARLPVGFFRRSAEAAAADLLGRFLVREEPGSGVRTVARIVETEAYLGVIDRASHAWNGRRTERTETLYRAGGCAYVFLVYGMHNCLNVVTGPEGEASAVLIRAAAPVEGVEVMAMRRGLRRPPRPGDLLGGPGKLCHALAIDRTFDGAPLDRGDLRIARGEPVTPQQVATGPRIGIDYAGEAVDWPLRFAIRGNREMSRPFL